VHDVPPIVQEYMLCKKFKVLPTAPTLYQEKYKIVTQFMIIENTIGELEEKEYKKQNKKGKGR